MTSRQWVLEEYTGKKFDFNNTDGASLCAQINQETVKWALMKAPIATVQRYLSHGKTLVPGTDIEVKTGFNWIHTKLVN